MKKVDKKNVTINIALFQCSYENKVSSTGKNVFGIATLSIIVFGVAALVVSRCCPELLSDYIRLFISTVSGI